MNLTGSIIRALENSDGPLYGDELMAKAHVPARYFYPTIRQLMEDGRVQGIRELPSGGCVGRTSFVLPEQP